MNFKNVIEIIDCVANLIAIATFLFGIATYKKGVDRETKQATLEAYRCLQEEVLDKLASVNKDNAVLFVENFDNPKCKQVYNDYRVLIARLEHFAVGINEKIYSFDTVDRLGGVHLIYLYKKVEPIINKANELSDSNVNYIAYRQLVIKLLNVHPEIKMRI